MKASITLGRWFGVPVGLHYSWFVIAWLIALSLVTQFAAINPRWPAAMVWALALVTAALFFVCIVLHELAHASVARASGIPVRGITLFALGGIAQIEKDAASPAKEFWMAIAGPGASFGLGILCRGLAAAAGWGAPAQPASALAAVFGWLGYINIGLALFNLVPGFPLDGGRVLRAVIWGVTHDARRATRIAARVGQAVAFLFIASGLWSLVARGNFGGLWIAFIGWFLLEGAQASVLQAELAEALKDIRVADVMARNCAMVDAGASLQQFVADYLLHFAGRCFAVTRGDRIVGLITTEDVKRVDRDRWTTTTVGEAMRPLEALHALDPNASAGEALARMGEENVNQLPVVSGGRLEGIVTRSYLVHLLQLRQELGA